MGILLSSCVFPGICYMPGCTIVDSFLRGPLDGSTARIGAPDRMPAWHICLESLGMPCLALHALALLTPPRHICIQGSPLQCILHLTTINILLPLFSFIFILRRVVSIGVSKSTLYRALGKYFYRKWRAAKRIALTDDIAAIQLQYVKAMEGQDIVLAEVYGSI